LYQCNVLPFLREVIEQCSYSQGVGSAVNRLNDVVAMIAEVRSIANSLQTSFQTSTTYEVETQRQ